MAVDDDLRTLIDSQMPLVAKLSELGSLAPLAATLDYLGQIAGEAFTAEDDTQEHASVDEVIRHFETKFAADLECGAIQAAAIFFHGFVGDDGFAHAAHRADEAQAVIVRFLHCDSAEVTDNVIPYR